MSLIHKIKVSKGIYWVEIKEADLRILCASPADSVKYLMKMGLIVQAEHNGVKFETGPNAILLSDTLVQNGDICNLAEFPVLQMLYRQGMIIPNHPNNNHTKPILIGISEQIQSQLNYIYRGNYGLVSKEELLQCDLDEQTVNDIMRQKLKFAFGDIKNTNVFLDTCIVEDEKEEILNNVYIQRVEPNKFELIYKEESTLIDLNLDGTAGYDSPYSLNHFNINRDYFSIIHSGQGDGWSAGQPSMSSILIFQGKIYLIDACPNLDKVLIALGIGVGEIEGIFHTHVHDDHFNGLITLLKSNKKIKYFSSKLVRESMTKKLLALLNLEENKFENYFDFIDLDFNKWNNINGLEVKPILSPHPVENNLFIFRTFWENNYKSYGHFADLTSFDTLNSMLNDNEDEPGISEINVEKTKEDYLECVDIKKIDIGGGMIHGNAKDFKYDRSNKIVLSHISSGNYSEEEKIIGSSASFGTVDELIPNHSNFIPKFAKKYLHELIPSLKESQLSLLLNLDFVTFNPGTIIIKENNKNEFIYLLITGIAETISSKENIKRTLSSGTLMGNISGLVQMTSNETIRSLSYITTLKIPAKLYANIIHENKLYNLIEKQTEPVYFLYNTWLFRDEIAQSKMNEIVENIEYESYEKDHTLQLKNNKLYILQSGVIKRYVANEYIDNLKEKDFFNSSMAISGEPSAFTLITQTDCEVMILDASLFKDIPIIRWKLFEYNKKNKNIIIKSDMRRDSSILWEDEYSVNIQIIDNHHRKILFLINTINNSINTNNHYNLKINLESLIKFSKYHFEYEENLLTQYGFDLINHSNCHIELIKQIEDIYQNFLNDKDFDIHDIPDFLLLWIRIHILTEDKKYSSYLNSKNVF